MKKSKRERGLGKGEKSTDYSATDRKLVEKVVRRVHMAEGDKRATGVEGS